MRIPWCKKAVCVCVSMCACVCRKGGKGRGEGGGVCVCEGVYNWMGVIGLLGCYPMVSIWCVTAPATSPNMNTSYDIWTRHDTHEFVTHCIQCGVPHALKESCHIEENLMVSIGFVTASATSPLHNMQILWKVITCPTWMSHVTRRGGRG